MNWCNIRLAGFAMLVVYWGLNFFLGFPPLANAAALSLNILLVVITLMPDHERIRRNG
jgi:hypothetical protein